MTGAAFTTPTQGFYRELHVGGNAIEEFLWTQVKGLNSIIRVRMLRMLVERRPRLCRYYDLTVAMYDTSYYSTVQNIQIQKYLLAQWLDQMSELGLELGTIENFQKIGYALVGGEEDHLIALSNVLKDRAFEEQFLDS